MAAIEKFMSSNVIKLTQYRSTRRKLWLDKNKVRLQRFINSYISENFGLSFVQAATSYQNMCTASYEEAWDYIDFRNLIQQAMEGNFSWELYHQLKKQWWFDKKFLSKDEVLDYCLNLYISTSLYSASAER